MNTDHDTISIDTVISTDQLQGSKLRSHIGPCDRCAFNVDGMHLCDLHAMLWLTRELRLPVTGLPVQDGRTGRCGTVQGPPVWMTSGKLGVRVRMSDTRRERIIRTDVLVIC